MGLKNMAFLLMHLFIFRKRVKSTSKYIYQTLFLDGENSDIKLKVLGKEWKLHKLYLKQVIFF